MSEDFVIVEDLTKNFGDNVVLEDINFHVKEGGTFGILGKSGSGKTVLMHTIRGIKEYRPTRGSILYRLALCPACGWVEPPSRRGEECGKCGERLDFEEVNLWEEYGTPIFRQIYNRIALMIQRTFALYGEMPVLVNVTEALMDAGISRDRQQLIALRLLSRVKMTHRVLHVARDLSGGEKQRVVLARQLAKDPFILFADEPTGTLDPITAKVVHEVMLDQIEAGLTTFVTSHWLEAVSTLTKEGIVLEDGRIIASGKTEDIAKEVEKEFEEERKEIIDFREISSATVGEPCIILKNCKKNFYTYDRGVIKAIDDVSFSVNEAEIFGIIGVSGAGKTTLGRITAGLQDPSVGSVSIRIGDTWVDMGISGMNGRGRARPYISILHQEYDLYHHSNILENLTDSIGLAMPAEIARAKAIIALKAVGFSEEETKDILPRSPDEVSEGEKHRVALGRALMTEPHVLILDEPTGTIDPVTINDISRSILRSREELMQTYLIISHDPSFIESVCDRAMFMSAGKVVGIGGPKEIVDLFKEKSAPMEA
jgi:methyl coenzyme M reductase system subunit A2